jgi:antitoxin component YwqK of YwqJK toxin-antitoxin module
MIHKTLLYFTFIIISVNFSLSQSKSNISILKDYFLNGKLKAEYEWDTIEHVYAGKYKEFDSIGNLISEGTYNKVDSVLCKDCYDGTSKVDYENYPKYIPVGEWKYFHSNGKLKMVGFYDTKVHSYRNMPLEKPINAPVHVGISFDFLKTDKWNYFDENGKLIKIEEYIDGELIIVEE